MEVPRNPTGRAMNPSEGASHLSQISTRWTLVFQAHQGQKSLVADAQQALMERYGGAVYRYLLGALRDPDAADEVAQEFALRFVRGDFHRAHPERGRFRDFVKTAVYHLIVDYQRQRQKQPHSLPCDSAFLPSTDSDVAEADRVFTERWREELLDRAWEALAAQQRESGQRYYEVLRWRSEHPGTPAVRLAEELSARGEPVTEVGVRQTLHRAREKFADLLLQEVARSLETDDPDRLEQELIDLGLLPYCRPALQRRAR
jgi:RNA polymerase sigma-70 factor (ECF subfamily)